MANDTLARSLAIAALENGGGGGEPAAYIKSASVANNELTLTRKDDTTLTYSPDVDKAYVDSAIEDVEAEIPSLDGYATELYVNNHHDSTKQDTLTAGTNISIVNNVISATGGGSEPAAYLKSASVSNNTLTLTNKDNTTVEFTPDTGSEVSVSATGTATDEVQYITIDGVEKKLAGGGGGGSSYTFTNGLTESSGTVSWDLNDRIQAGTSNSVKLGNNLSSKQASLSSIVSGVIGNYDTTLNASGAGSFIGGYYGNYNTITASGKASEIFVSDTANAGAINASGDGSTVRGLLYLLTAILAKATGSGSMILGCMFASTGDSVAAEASGSGAIAGGYYEAFGSDDRPIKSTGKASIAYGKGLQALSDYQTVLGKYNVSDNQSTYGFILGNGTDYQTLSNAFTVDWSGNVVVAGTVTPTGADYAEYFEWKDGNPDNEDRMGYLVTLDEDKLVLADADDDIIGITSGTKAVIGDSAEMNWDDKYLKDELGREIYEDYDIEHPAIIDPETGEEIKPAWTEHIHTRKINPEWDPDRPYTPRSKRKEWYPVGLLGKLYVRDDGTAVVNGYVTANNGIATNSAEKTNLRVLERVNDHIIRVLVK